MNQNKINVEAEGSELILRNKAGDHVIIPKKYRREVQDMIAEGCHNCLDDLISTLPTMDDYAEDGSVIPIVKESLQPLGRTISTSDDGLLAQDIDAELYALGGDLTKDGIQAPIGDDIRFNPDTGELVNFDIQDAQQREAIARRQAVMDFYRNVGETPKSFKQRYGSYQKWKDQNVPITPFKNAKQMAYGGEITAEDGLVMPDGGGDPTKKPMYPAATSQPTRADSLMLLKNTQELENYYLGPEVINLYKRVNSETNPSILKNFVNESRTALNNVYNDIKNDISYRVPYNNKISERKHIKPQEYFIPINQYQYYQKDLSPHVLDTRAPFNLYDTRIVPQERLTLHNYEKGDAMYDNEIDYYRYNKLAVTPWNDLDFNRKKLRLEHYGTSGTPFKTVEEGLKYLSSNPSPKPNPKLNPKSNTTQTSKMGASAESATPAPKPLQLPEEMKTRSLDQMLSTPNIPQRDMMQVPPMDADAMPDRIDKFRYGRNAKEEKRRLAGKSYHSLNDRGIDVFNPSGDLHLDQEDRMGFHYGQAYLDGFSEPNIPKKEVYDKAQQRFVEKEKKRKSQQE